MYQVSVVNDLVKRFQENLPKEQAFEVGLFPEFRQELVKSENAKYSNVMGEEGIEPATN